MRWQELLMRWSVMGGTKWLDDIYVLFGKGVGIDRLEVLHFGLMSFDLYSLVRIMYFHEAIVLRDEPSLHLHLRPPSLCLIRELWIWPSLF